MYNILLYTLVSVHTYKTSKCNFVCLCPCFCFCFIFCLCSITHLHSLACHGASAISTLDGTQVVQVVHAFSFLAILLLFMYVCRVRRCSVIHRSSASWQRVGIAPAYFVPCARLFSLSPPPAAAACK
ncbi:hypothetical protein B0T24DRAFT_193550 [Lasiosphaeria ovina]|uniref:Uncharacterized protein n=1 Tax=Lasiosphaeria ovina TaxID=92902 RepID=A0AAE0NF91_9PEZI|nr:hypothetical protein B0T24DRAFT_193550 [Lasiosphaeria ovina]